MSEAQPETVAGRSLVAMLQDHTPFGSPTRLWREVLAIEAEARAAGAARYEAALRQIAEPKEVAGECIWCMTDFGHAADPDCPVTVASRALAAAPLAEQGDGLDVERLARALRAQHDAFLKEPESFDTARQVAEAIAAEYARLTPSRPAEERKKGDEWRDGVHLPSMADPSDD